MIARAEVAASIDRLFHWAAFADKSGGAVQETTIRGLVAALHEPLGVIGIACPDEPPLLAFVSLIAPAISRGNTVVCIPSPAYPLSAPPTSIKSSIHRTCRLAWSTSSPAIAIIW